MKKPRSFRNGLAAAFVVFAFAGCEAKMYPISGTVRIGGAPFANGSVSLIPVGPGRPAYGGTDAEGKFTLETGNTPGAPKGTYKLVLQKFESAGGPTDERTPGEERRPLRPTVPDKYSKPETSDITVEVPSPNGKYDFDIPKP